MKKKDSSSWSEIKLLDERLAKEPDSFCFARLSEVYLKVGLVADALHTARQGVAKHPGYLAGQRALAMACNANGLQEESRSILERVTAAVPEDAAAQKLLASLYVEAGDKASAIRAYATLLDFRPDDVKSKAQLEDLQQSDTGEPMDRILPFEPSVFADEADERLEDDAEVGLVESREEDVEAGVAENVENARTEDSEEDIYELSEDDIFYDDEDAGGSVKEVELVAPPAFDLPAPGHHDPLSTLTLAELYEQQGFIAKALDIYRTILADDPANTQLQAKITALENQESSSHTVSEHSAVSDLHGEQEPAAFASFEDLSAPVEARNFSPLGHKQPDVVVGILGSWLENIRRIKACR